NLSEGDTVYLSNPGGVDGMTIGGFYTISSVTANSFQITANTGALTGNTFVVPGQTVMPPYQSVDPGEATRTNGNGTITADLSGNSSSPFYTITATVAVDDGTGQVKTSQVTYRVDNQQSNLLNQRYSAGSATADGTLVSPNTGHPLAQAILV